MTELLEEEILWDELPKGVPDLESTGPAITWPLTGFGMTVYVFGVAKLARLTCLLG
jgi:hypothetical protein